MNLAFYIDSLSDSDQTTSIFKTMNSLLSRNAVKDASLFYNKIDFNANTPKFGMFNATELWSFNGLLISTTAKNALLASSVVNDIKNHYLFNHSDINVFELVRVAQLMPILVTNKEDEQYIQRVTGKAPINIDLGENSIMSLLGASNGN